LQKIFKRLDAGGAVRNAVAAESDDRKIIATTELVVIPKNVSEKKVITDALLSNTFMRGLSQTQLSKLIDAMEKGEYAAGTEIITENGTGNEMYIIQDGEVRVTKVKLTSNVYLIYFNFRARAKTQRTLSTSKAVSSENSRSCTTASELPLSRPKRTSKSGNFIDRSSRWSSNLLAKRRTKNVIRF